jgi:hypothetical protein
MQRLDGTGTSVILGKTAEDVSAFNTVIAGTTAVRMKWDDSHRSGIMSADNQTTLQTLSLEPQTLAFGYNDTNQQLVGRFRGSGVNPPTYTIKIADADTLATKTTVVAMQTTVGNHTTQLATLALDSVVTSMNTTLGNTNTQLSALQLRVNTQLQNLNTTVDNHTTQLANLALSSTIVAVNDDLRILTTTVGNHTTQLATLALNSVVQNMNTTLGNTNTQLSALQLSVNTQLQNLNTTVGNQTTKLMRLDGTGSAVVLGAVPSGTATGYDTFIGGTTGANRMRMRWDSNSLSAIQSLNTSTALTGLTLPDSSVVWGYQTTPIPALVSTFQGTGSSEKYTVTHSQYRAIFEMPKETTTPTMTLADYPDRFCVFDPTTPSTTQTLTICAGLTTGMEIEIFNNTIHSLSIVLAAGIPELLLTNVRNNSMGTGGTLRSIGLTTATGTSGNAKVSAGGAAVLKVRTSTSFFLIGALVA